MHDSDATFDLNRGLADLARELAGETDSGAAFAQLTAHVLASVEGADGCGITLLKASGRLETVGSTGPDPEAADVLQYRLGDGPCMRSVRKDEVVHVGDLEVDERWPRWSRPVAERLGYRSVLSAHLFTNGRQVGAVNVYGKRTHAFTAADVTHIPFFAAHAAAAIVSVRTIEQLREALVSRTRIGQAEGIVMERFAIDEERAFAVLTRLSQHRNEKLRDVAEAVVHDRLPPPDPTLVGGVPEGGASG